jgi:hypothetical protein
MSPKDNLDEIFKRSYCHILILGVQLSNDPKRTGQWTLSFGII